MLVSPSACGRHAIAHAAAAGVSTSRASAARRWCACVLSNSVYTSGSAVELTAHGGRNTRTAPSLHPTATNCPPGEARAVRPRSGDRSAVHTGCRRRLGFCKAANAKIGLFSTRSASGSARAQVSLARLGAGSPAATRHRPAGIVCKRGAPLGLRPRRCSRCSALRATGRSSHALRGYESMSSTFSASAAALVIARPDQPVQQHINYYTLCSTAAEAGTTGPVTDLHTLMRAPGRARRRRLERP